MNEQEAAKVLALAATYDFRMTPPSDQDALVRAGAWAMALHDDLPLDFAMKVVIDHYAKDDTSITPAKLNYAWTERRRRERAVEAMRDRQALPVGVPMPAEVRAQLKALQLRRPGE